MDADVTRGFALAALFFGAATFIAALATGGDVPLIALGFLLELAAMDLFRVAGAPQK